MNKSGTLPSKPHFPILDGLRGVAALTVVIFHILEAHATSSLDLMINHGYLAVDFFFLLSGFVIGYAYDDRWGKMTMGGFFKRRLIRLQPMVVMGSVIGAIFFYFQDSPIWPKIHEVPVWYLLVIMVIGATMLPVTISMDVRGWNEMHPLNGPAWSLFFEYIGNFLYAAGIRKLSKAALAVLVAVCGIWLACYAITSERGEMIGGWTLSVQQLKIGFIRLLFPFFAGLLLFRTVKLVQIKNAFLWCSLILLTVLGMPRIGGAENMWANGIYESITIILVFPLIVFLGASGVLEGKAATGICKFLGDISYPIYISHYPLIYTYTGWVSKHKGITLTEAAPYAILTFVSAVVIAWVCLKYYDEPVRKWLQQKLMPVSKTPAPVGVPS
ncbi:Peptidoglycan/LPS O-acetylase OafA/YrhL, contains acyltransferase and SGNH-hydrolase domains [Chitinophaga jiangningensis]|uniref:Peptidoglycan/LPS O-acetylase OafA/YrhL, contains acyltransferase and SGNH-hydrolase domains n=1 Tax=Chitinophaga jiangningensis TaxID=1419482 RepID=A0A1M6XSQ9_9BACT|nr:acyltransferase [Chitinophaga jiangningensis]SHL09027.1 Peptidoglycan/LPS O-acetylase OafA/YrhL, contains acyltransferase and SGNH-hydrolase domains [Chitinophaga jiangningensis]